MSFHVMNKRRGNIFIITTHIKATFRFDSLTSKWKGSIVPGVCNITVASRSTADVFSLEVRRISCENFDPSHSAFTSSLNT